MMAKKKVKKELPKKVDLKNKKTIFNQIEIPSFERMAGFFVHVDNPSLVHNRKAGYAAESVEIIIPPMYEADFPFTNGHALVSFHADIQTDREHSW